MPPRLPAFSWIRVENVSSNFTPKSISLPIRSFTSSSSCLKAAGRKRARFRDPYAVAQANARKAANLSKQASLKEERSLAMGDPVRGVSTPFVESFGTAMPLENEPILQSGTHNLNHLLSKDVIEKAQQQAEKLSSPSENERKKYKAIKNGLNQPSDIPDMLRPSSPSIAKGSGGQWEVPDMYKSRMLSTEEQGISRFEAQEAERETANKVAAEAIGKIVNLSTGNSKDRTRMNVKRCIAMFGRHRTDSTLPPKPAARLPVPGSKEHVAKEKVRAGPDTGSSEVQIAILTAKIKALADFLETRGKPDKINKRNLRLLVHRRQKLLSYLRRKERGGPRWTHVIETLGLTEGTWKGEISL